MTRSNWNPNFGQKSQNSSFLHFDCNFWIKLHSLSIYVIKELLYFAKLRRNCGKLTKLIFNYNHVEIFLKY